MLAAVACFLICLAAIRSESAHLYRAARSGTVLLLCLLTFGSTILMYALVTSDFRLAYVVSFTERALPMGYKVAAFWAGQEGSLLLWAWMLAVMTVIFAFQRRKQQSPEHIAAIAVLVIVIGFFAALMYEADAANPFAPAAEAVADGHGMNPQLQNIGMIAHPPTLFLGYAGYTIPFALLIGALFTRRIGQNWIAAARPWALVSWIFLGVGIILGAEWAYVELGWGGYWAWDAVENASLLPWLAGTALLHTMVAQRQRDLYKRWNVFLAATSFILCILAAYITRSGIVQSVHAFEKSNVGIFLLVFLSLTILLTIVAVARSWRSLRTDRPVLNLVSREGALLSAAVLLVIITTITLVGTLWPALGGDKKPTPVFYNRYVLPFGLLLTALMGLGPILSYGENMTRKLRRLLTLPIILAVVTIAGLLSMRYFRIWALASGAAVAVVIGGILSDLLPSIRSRQQNTGENILVSAFRLLFNNHQRYGAQLAHVGMAMIVIGVAGSSLYPVEQFVQLAKHASAQVGNYSITLDDAGMTKGENYIAVEARVKVMPPSGHDFELRPQQRKYYKWRERNTEVDFRTSWRHDFYVSIADWNDDLSLVALRVLINPLVLWIWAGGIVLTLGGLICIIPRRGRVEIAEEPQDAGLRESATDTRKPGGNGSPRKIPAAIPSHARTRR